MTETETVTETETETVPVTVGDGDGDGDGGNSVEERDEWKRRKQNSLLEGESVEVARVWQNDVTDSAFQTRHKWVIDDERTVDMQLRRCHEFA